ncbi:zinc ribbon domain-containing protein [Actinomadura sp. CNU-125]|uniref:zinc ribbon domain-containing protein n=1 Tax=Actinomadura sp. CNU-125 TaxID=1904961 RepID=UPI00291609FA|nr:zinc ribbon domain-containing protein [Actinomadura sp. CNU-125]
MRAGRRSWACWSTRRPGTGGRSRGWGGRFRPRSCSGCGLRDGPKPLHVRAWTCGQCGAVHDRDINAARNILDEGRRIASG